MTPAPRPAVLLDRDGVVNGVVADPVKGTPESPLRPSDVTLLPGVAESVAALRAAGFAVVIVSNQPAVAKGTISLNQLRSVHRAVAAGLGPVDGWRYCLHHPEGTMAPLAGVCRCRKPAPGLLFAAAVELDLDLAASWMVGDADTDVEAGTAAGARTILVEHADTAHRRAAAALPTLIVSDLVAATKAILDR